MKLKDRSAKASFNGRLILVHFSIVEKKLNMDQDVQKIQKFLFIRIVVSIYHIREMTELKM